MYNNINEIFIFSWYFLCNVMLRCLLIYTTLLSVYSVGGRGRTFKGEQAVPWLYGVFLCCLRFEVRALSSDYPALARSCL